MTAWPRSSRPRTARIDVETKSGKTHPADIVILALGVRPDTTLAKMAGLTIGERGGIRVDDQMRTSNPDIFAVGDAVEVKDFVTGEWALIALAGPANRQGRIAADVIAGRNSHFRGSQGTSIIGLFGAAAAWTGVSEKTLNRIGDKDYEKIYLYPNSHAGYYPGARPIAMKVIFRKSDGRLLGAQALGEDNVDKRISALGDGAPDGRDRLRPRGSRALLRAPVRQREGPGQFRRDGGRRRAAGRHADQRTGIPPRTGFVLDVRDPFELAVESHPGAVNIPIGAIAGASQANCRATARSLCFAAPDSAPTSRRECLLQNGFKAKTISGGMLSLAHYGLFDAEPEAA